MLNKFYGDNHALKDFSYEFSEGVYGLLGPNGAGKSTLMNIITDNLKESGGDIYFNGENVKKLGREFRRVLGYMPQQQGLYSNFTLLRFMFYMAALKGMSKSEAANQIDRILKQLNLDRLRYHKLGSFSGGMKQRVLIAQAMLGDPKIIILDEPTAGLDPKERIRMRNLIAEIALDKIVIIATHVVSDIEFIAREVLLLKHGSLIDSGPPHKLCKKLAGMVYEIEAARDDIADIEKRFRIGNISREEDTILVRVTSENPPSGYTYRELKPGLEDVYLYFFEEGISVKV
jgi:ABC-type multidrug transport system ATPase subunit